MEAAARKRGRGAAVRAGAKIHTGEEGIDLGSTHTRKSCACGCRETLFYFCVGEDKRGKTNMTKTSFLSLFPSPRTLFRVLRASQGKLSPLSRRFSSNYLVGSHPVLLSVPRPSSASSGGGVSNEVVIESAFFTTGSVLRRDRTSKRMPCPERL